MTLPLTDRELEVLRQLAADRPGLRDITRRVMATIDALVRRVEVAEARAHYWKSKAYVADLEDDHGAYVDEGNDAMADQTEDRIADADRVVAAASDVLRALGVEP